jgi:hypothetical protein
MPHIRQYIPSKRQVTSYQTTRFHNPEGYHINSCRNKTLKPHKFIGFFSMAVTAEILVRRSYMGIY